MLKISLTSFLIRTAFVSSSVCTCYILFTFYYFISITWVLVLDISIFKGSNLVHGNMRPIFSLIRLYSPALEIIDGVMCEGWISVALKDKKKIQAMATITEKILYYNLYYLCIEIITPFYVFLAYYLNKFSLA